MLKRLRSSKYQATIKPNLQINSFLPKPARKQSHQVQSIGASQDSDLEPIKSFKFSAGLNQRFNQTSFKVDLSGYDEDDLTSFRQDDYYPLVIGIETVFPDKYKGRAKRSIEYTYGSFYSE
jgi:hypothetical protein